MTRRPRATLVIMARWPRLGQGKSRLAAETSPATAVRVQRHSLARLIHRLRRLSGVRLVIALANPADYRQASKHRLFHGLPLINQHPGDLGQRMHDQLLHHGARGCPTLIIGSDLANVRRRDISAALAALKNHPFVLGPASDGGFWLIGWRGGAPRTLPNLDGIAWSQPTTRAKTIERLEGTKSQGQSVRLIREASDMDDRQSLRIALARRDLSRP